MAVVTERAIKIAEAELAAKSKETIELETAIKWAARAIVAYERALEEPTEVHSRISPAALRWLLAAAEYEHEALEHATLSDPLGDTAARIARDIQFARARR